MEISVQPASITMIATTFMVREGLIVTGDSIKACSIAVLAQEILHFADSTLRACTVSPIHLVKNGIGKARYTGNKCCSTNASQTGRPGSPFSATWSETSQNISILFLLNIPVRVKREVCPKSSHHLRNWFSLASIVMFKRGEFTIRLYRVSVGHRLSGAVSNLGQAKPMGGKDELQITCVPALTSR